MGQTFLESIWIGVYTLVFARLKQEAAYGGTRTDEQMGVEAAAQADAACANLPEATVTAQRAAIAALKAP